MWTLYAVEPLQLHSRAFVEVLATNPKTGLEYDDILGYGTLLTICGGLITLQPIPGRPWEDHFRFIHYSTKEVFVKHPCTLFPETGRHHAYVDEPEYVTRAHTELTSTCLAYLNNFQGTRYNTEGSMCGKHFPFLEYALLNWGTHAAQSTHATVKEIVFVLFDKYRACEVSTGRGQS